AKPCAIGFRIEHPQSLIDRARLGRFAGHPELGAADYKLVHHASNGRSVYSFCMCPGGTVVAATSEPNRVVTNGMSQYSRNERNANAGIVVGITPQDYALDRDASGPVSPLDGIAFQRHWESRAFELGGGAYEAPAQLVGDFIRAQRSTKFGSVLPSYKPGLQLTDLASSLPSYAIDAIREALPAFERQIAGFAMNDAVLTGVETRTSSPLRITRASRARPSAPARSLRLSAATLTSSSSPTCCSRLSSADRVDESGASSATRSRTSVPSRVVARTSPGVTHCGLLCEPENIERGLTTDDTPAATTTSTPITAPMTAMVTSGRATLAALVAVRAFV